MLRICTQFDAFIMILMVVTGALLTLDLKWSNETPSENSINEVMRFSHPFLQSTFMFLGELFCLGIYFIQQLWKRPINKSEASKKQPKGE